MVSLASTEAPDKGLLPGHARLLLVHFLKEAELNISLSQRTSVTYVKLPKRTCQGLRGSGMMALCSPALEMESAPRGVQGPPALERGPCPLSAFVQNSPRPLSKSCLLSGLPSPAFIKSGHWSQAQN